MSQSRVARGDTVLCRILCACFGGLPCVADIVGRTRDTDALRAVLVHGQCHVVQESFLAASKGAGINGVMDSDDTTALVDRLHSHV